MTTAWKKLTRKDLTTFDDFATDAVLTAMELGGVGRIASSGHAKIRANRTTMTISRDTSAPHCRGNVMSRMKQVFPELKPNGSTQKDKTMTSGSATATQAPTDRKPLECPAKGCNQTFADAGLRDAHVDAEHLVCKWEGCDYGPNGGPYVGTGGQAIAGHTNVRHKGNKPWERNREIAAAHRAETFAAKKAKREREAAEQEAGRTLETEVATGNGSVSSIEEWADRTGASKVVEPVAVPVPTVDTDAETKLALIREILGDDTEVTELKKQVADLTAHLALVREAVGLDFGDDDN